MSEARIVAVYPLGKSSLHQRPVYQHRLENKVPLRALPSAPRALSQASGGFPSQSQATTGHDRPESNKGARPF